MSSLSHASRTMQHRVAFWRQVHDVLRSCPTDAFPFRRAYERMIGRAVSAATMLARTFNDPRGWA